MSRRKSKVENAQIDEELSGLATEDDKAVVDEAATEEIHSDIFSITSYGADYTVDGLVKRMDKKTFYVPDFQRSFIWNQRQASRFIESLLMGLPVPGLFVFKEQDSEKHLIVDGQQRLKTLQYYYSGTFRERKFRLLDVNERWLDKTYEELDESDRQILDDQIIHTTIFKQEKPENGKKSIYEVFERINTGGVKLSAQEIRSCVSHGKFIDLLRDLNDDQNWRAIYGPKSDRLKDQELILRFLALSISLTSYKRPLRRFLDNFLDENASLNKRKSDEFRELFVNTIAFASQTIGSNAFRPDKQLNTAVFDSVMVGLASRLKKKSTPETHKVVEEYNRLLSLEEYRLAYTKSTADEEQVRTRMRLATEAFEST